jgi:hypothetical protein
MRAVVVYESMYGNTREVASAIGAGLETAFEVSVVPVSEAGPEGLADADLVVVGGPTHMYAAAFDTRLHGPAAMTGRASRGVARLLRAHGFALVAEPESFLVTKQDRLEPDEAGRAREWGIRLAAGIAASQAAPGTRS